MSTSLHDVESTVLLRPGVYPGEVTSNEFSDSIDFIESDGSCFAIQIVGIATGTSPSLTGKMQESDDDTNWNDIPGAVFNAVTTAFNVQVITFQRSQRYVRYSATISGTTPSFQIATLIGSEKKMI